MDDKEQWSVPIVTPLSRYILAVEMTNPESG